MASAQAPPLFELMVDVLAEGESGTSPFGATLHHINDETGKSQFLPPRPVSIQWAALHCRGELAMSGQHHVASGPRTPGIPLGSMS